jgi:hypothetical protein
MDKPNTETWEQFVWRVASAEDLGPEIMEVYYMHIDNGLFQFEAADKALRDFDLL